MNHRPLVFLDIETTGGSTRRRDDTAGAARSDAVGLAGSSWGGVGRITEIGALRVENGRVVRTFSQLLDPEQPIPYFITRLTGIDNHMVRGQPTFAEIADELRALLDGAIFVAHSVQFDYGFIKAEYARLGQAFNMDRLCTVRLSRRMHPEQGRHGLDRVIERLGVQVANRHRAYDDAEVLWRLFTDEYARDELALFRAMEKLLVKTTRKAR